MKKKTRNIKLRKT